MRFPALLFTVFIDSLGFGLIFPLLPPLFMSSESAFIAEGTSLEMRGFLFGILIGSFCLGQFFGSPILGALSDRKGRKKILSMTLWIALVSYLIGGVSILMKSLAGLFVARILAGIAAGNYSIAQSIVADVSEENEKTKNFALIGMAWGVGFVLGPFLGGEFSDPCLCSFFSWETPFWVASAFCFLNVVLVRLFLKESLCLHPGKKLEWHAGILDLKKAFSHPKLRSIFLVMFIFCFGWGFFTEFSSVLLIRKLGASVKDISFFYAGVGFWIALCQGLLIRPFLKRFSSEALLAFSLFSLGAILLLILLVNTTYQLQMIIPFLAFFEAFVFPSSATLVSNLSDKQMQGEALGLYNSIQWAAIGLAPLFSGSLVASYPHLPATVASVCMFCSLGFLLWVFWKRSRKTVQDRPF